ncbi:TadE family type IV pilus minor pilin [Streptomyces pseudogriseolus]|uniref:TadE family type IV pilus minor pilin n=1 Tax=Streptomyces pseudogriseolus TaxID=36817 RepID=UPI00346EC494
MAGCDRWRGRWRRGWHDRRGRGRRDGRRDRGFVTAESAMVLPVLVLVMAALVWGLMAVAAQIKCVDAARAGARAAARQDPPDAVVEVTREAAPAGARITVGRDAGQVRVTVVARVPMLRALPFELREEAVAAAEEAVVAVGVGRGT